jgi:hypothetical protein
VLNSEFESTKELALNDWHVRKKQYTALAVKAVQNECPEVLEQLVADMGDLKVRRARPPARPPACLPACPPACLVTALPAAGGPACCWPPGAWAPACWRPAAGLAQHAAARCLSPAPCLSPPPAAPRRPYRHTTTAPPDHHTSLHHAPPQVPTYFVKDLIAELGRRKAGYPLLKQLLAALEVQRGPSDQGVAHAYYELVTVCQRRGLAAEARELFAAAEARGVALSAGLLKYRDTLAPPAPAAPEPEPAAPEPAAV